VVNKDGPVHVLRNVVGRGHWIMFRVLNRAGCDAIGATLRIEAAGRVQWRGVTPNQSYCSSNDPRVHFGLGTAEQVEHVTVYWPDRTQASFGPFTAGQLYELRQGRSGSPGVPGKTP
jgi:hypothetical protein